MKQCEYVVTNFERCCKSLQPIPDRTQPTKLVWHDTGRKESSNKVIVQTRMYPIVRANYCYYHEKHKKGLFDAKRKV